LNFANLWAFIKTKEKFIFWVMLHGLKGFVIPTKSFVKIGITKIFCYNNKMFSYINKTFGCRSKFLVATTKTLFVVPNFVAVTKPFFPCVLINTRLKFTTLSNLLLIFCSFACSYG